MLKRVLAIAIVVASVTPSLFAQIVGYVYDRNGKAVAGATVAAHRQETSEARLERLRRGELAPPVPSVAGEPSTGLVATTTDEGRFELRGAPPGVVELHIDAMGLVPARLLVWSDAQPRAVALARLPEVEGKVVAGGKGIAGAIVSMRGRDGRIFAVKTSAGGTFRAPDPGRWSEEVSVFHPDYAPLLQGRPLDAQRLVWELQPGITVHGRVTSADGGAVANAALFVDSLRYGVSGDDGAFVLKHVPSNYATIEARAATGVASSRQAPSPLTLRMQPSRTLDGIVRSAAGKQLGGVIVAAGPQSEGTTSREVLTDAAGRYRFDTLSPARYGVYATAPEFGPPVYRDDDSSAAELRTRRSETREIVLQPLTAIPLSVVDEEGKTVGGAAAVALPASAPAFQAFYGGEGESVTTPDGSGSVFLAPEWSEQLQLIVRHVGFAPARSQRFSLGAETPSKVVVRLTRGIAATVTVTDSDGHVVEGAEIAWSEVDEKSGFRPPADRLLLGGSMLWPRTAADGQVKLRLGSGKYDFAAKAKGFLPTEVRGFDIASRQNVAVVLRRAAEVRGVVVREDGAPVAGARVQAATDGLRGMDTSVVTEANGAFVIAEVAPGEVRIVVNKHEEMIQEEKIVTAPASNVRIVIPPAGRLRGTVVHARTRQPLPRFNVALRRRDDAEGRRPMQVVQKEFTDPSGSFAFESLPTGELDVSVVAEGYIPSIRKKVEIRKSDETVVEILADPGASISGRVTDESGAAVADASVMVEVREERGGLEERFGPPMSPSDEQGEYALKGIRPGRLTIVVRKQGFVPWRRDVDAEGDSRLDVTLSRGSTLRGVVTRRGAPVEGADVIAHSVAFNVEGQGDQTDARGEFEISGLAPTLYTVVAMKEGVGQAQLKELDVRSAGRLAIELESSGHGTVIGRVSGLPPGFTERYQMRIVGAATEEGYEQGGIEADGSFRIENAPAGTLRVRAHLQGERESRSSDERVVELAPGGEVRVELTFGENVTVRGRVTREGAPLGGASIFFSLLNSDVGASTATDASGAYEIALARPGAYLVGVHGRELNAGYQARHTIEGSTTLDIDVTEIVLAGSVVSSDDGAAIAGARVALVPGGGTTPFYTGESVTDEEGEFRFIVSTTGDYRLIAERQGFGQASMPVSVQRSIADLRLELSRSEGLKVRIVDAMSGHPLQGSLVVRDSGGVVVLSGGRPMRSDGSMMLPLAPGRYRLTAMAWEYASRVIDVGVPGSMVDIPLGRGGSVAVVAPSDLQGSVRLDFPDGTPYPFCCDAAHERQLLGARTLLENVAAGSYSIVVKGSDGSVVFRQPVMVGERALTEVVVQLR